MTHLRIRFFDGSNVVLANVQSVSYKDENVALHDAIDGGGNTIAVFQQSAIIGWWYIKYEVQP